MIQVYLQIWTLNYEFLEDDDADIEIPRLSRPEGYRQRHSALRSARPGSPHQRGHGCGGRQRCISSGFQWQSR